MYLIPRMTFRKIVKGAFRFRLAPFLIPGHIKWSALLELKKRELDHPILHFHPIQGVALLSVRGNSPVFRKKQYPSRGCISTHSGSSEALECAQIPFPIPCRWHCDLRLGHEVLGQGQHNCQVMRSSFRNLHKHLDRLSRCRRTDNRQSAQDQKRTQEQSQRGIHRAILPISLRYNNNT